MDKLHATKQASKKRMVPSSKMVKKVLDFTPKSAILFEVMREKIMREKKKFLNVVFNIKRNPDYKGNHELAGFNGIHTTFPLGTTEQEMIDQFHAERVNIDINGKTWTKGEMIQVVSIEKCFEDWSDR